MYILIGGLSVNFSWILMIYSNSDTEYDPSGNSNFPFDVGPGILNSLFSYDFFIFFLV